jgi:hypothetical protein
MRSPTSRQTSYIAGIGRLVQIEGSLTHVPALEQKVEVVALVGKSYSPGVAVDFAGVMINVAGADLRFQFVVVEVIDGQSDRDGGDPTNAVQRKLIRSRYLQPERDRQCRLAGLQVRPKR